MIERRTSREEMAAELARLRAEAARLEAILGRDDPACAGSLQGEERFAEALLDSMRVPIYVVEPETYRILRCNQVFLDQYGLSRDQAIDHTCYEVTQRRNTPCANSHQDCPLLASVSTGLPSLKEFEFPGEEGESMDLECATTPISDSGGRVTKVIHVVRDITHRKRIELRLRRSLDFLRNLINSTVDAVIASDMTGRILLFNDAAQQITGYSESEALEELDIRDLYPEDGAREVMRRLRSEDFGGKGKLKPIDMTLMAKDGTEMPISLSAAIVYEGAKEISTVGFFSDLREKKAMEAELDKTRIQLLQAEKMASIGKLAAGVAHQLNNPLSGITLYAHALKEEYELEPQAQEDLGRILMNTERCRETVKELLQFARQTKQEIVPADLNQALKRVAFLLENQAQFHDIQVVRRLDDKLPPVPADIQQLGHVFMNLVLNAADAMSGRGTITVTSSLDEAGERAVVEIADTGPGIPDHVLPHLFEPFFTTKDEGKGTGLGLSVAYGVIENHGGKISARNRDSGGAVFRIELPLHMSREGVGVD